MVTGYGQRRTNRPWLQIKEEDLARLKKVAGERNINEVEAREVADNVKTSPSALPVQRHKINPKPHIQNRHH